MTTFDSLRLPHEPVLVLDWGGVLTTPIQDGFDIWIAAESIDTENFMATMRGYHDTPDSPLHQRECGKISIIEFEEVLAQSLRTTSGNTVSAQGLLDRMFAYIDINHGMMRIVNEARGNGWMTVVLSNAWGDQYDEALIARFDAFVMSDRIGVRKPDPAAFEAVMDALEIRAEQCIFVDDMRRNVAAANEFGMQGIRYTTGVEGILHRLITGTDDWEGIAL